MTSNLNFEIIQDNRQEILDIFAQRVENALEECGMVAEGYAKLLCPTDTGALKNSITYKVNDKTCYIGTNMEYAPYVELGTGKHYPSGRKTPWFFQGRDGKWHMTKGLEPRPYIKPALADHVGQYRNIIVNELKG